MLIFLTKCLWLPPSSPFVKKSFFLFFWNWVDLPPSLLDNVFKYTVFLGGGVPLNMCNWNSSYVSGERNLDENIWVINRSFVYRNAELENKRGTCVDTGNSALLQDSPHVKSTRRRKQNIWRISDFHKTLSELHFCDAYYLIWLIVF